MYTCKLVDIDGDEAFGSLTKEEAKQIYEEYSSSTFDGEFIESYYKCTPLNLGYENSHKILSYPPKVSLDMYYNNQI